MVDASSASDVTWRGSDTILCMDDSHRSALRALLKDMWISLVGLDEPFRYHKCDCSLEAMIGSRSVSAGTRNVAELQKLMDDTREWVRGVSGNQKASSQQLGCAPFWGQFLLRDAAFSWLTTGTLLHSKREGTGDMLLCCRWTRR